MGHPTVQGTMYVCKKRELLLREIMVWTCEGGRWYHYWWGTEMQKSSLTCLPKVHWQDKDGSWSPELSCSSAFIPLLSLFRGLVSGLEVLASSRLFYRSGLRTCFWSAADFMWIKCPLLCIVRVKNTCGNKPNEYNYNMDWTQMQTQIKTRIWETQHRAEAVELLPVLVCSGCWAGHSPPCFVFGGLIPGGFMPLACAGLLVWNLFLPQIKQ